MDTKQALDILNLTSDASLEDAKVSFRILAKKYHPDKLMITDEKTIDHEKMKDINLAFHYLNNILKPKKVSASAQDIANPKESKQKKPQKKAETKRTYFSEGFTSLFKTIHQNFFNTTKVKTNKVKTKNKTSKSSTSFKATGESGGKPTGKSDNYERKKKTFDSVLHKTIKSSLKKNIKKPYNFKSKQKVKSQNNYYKYMELKQKMRSKRKRIYQEGFTPIEKICPISKIKKF